MASRQFLRRLPPILRNVARALPVTRSAAGLPHHAVVSRGLPQQLTVVRCMCERPTTAEIVHIQDEDDFKKYVLNSTKLIIVDFHANWCGPCKLLDPRLETVIAKEKGKIVLAKVDIDDNIEIAMQFEIQSVPTVLAFKDGKLLDRFIGLKDFDEVEMFIQGLQ